MNWLATFVFAVLLLSVQYDAVQSASPTKARSPWANPAQAGPLMNCLINNLAGSSVLPQQDKEDLKSIMDTLMSAINGANAKGKSSSAQLQAINMAVASSLAEIVVAEDASSMASIGAKTQALSGALEQCFQSVMGRVDRKFINEINDLITMFAKEAASESNDIQDQGAFYASGSSASSKFQASSQSFQASSQTAGGYSTYTAPQVSQPALFVSSPQVSQTAPILAKSQVSQSAQTFNVPQVSQPATAGYTGATSSYGGKTQFGSTISQTSAASTLKATSQTFQGTTQTSEGYNTYQGTVYTRPQVSQPAPIVDKPLVSQPASAFIWPQVSQTASVAVESATYSGGAQFGSTSSQASFGQTSAAGQTNYLQPSGPQTGVISRIANALANTSTMRTVLKNTVSQRIVTTVIQKTVQTLARNLGIDGNNLSTVAQQTISQVPAGSDTSAYVQALSTALVKAGVLNASNIDTVGSTVITEVLKGVSSAAQGAGINVDTGSVQNDIRSSTGFLSTSSSSSSFSQTAASTTSGAATTGYTGEVGPIDIGPQFSQPAVTGYTGTSTGTEQFESVSGQTSYGQTSGFTAPATGGQISFGQTSGFTASATGSQASFGTTGGVSPGVISTPGLSGGVSVASTLNSYNALRSGSAASRISQFTSSIANAISPNGVDTNGLARSLQASFSSLRSSGISSSDAKIEVLLEAIVGLLQLLSNTQIRGVNMVTASSVANSAARSFELVLA